LTFYRAHSQFKKITNGEKRKAKKNLKTEKPKDKGHLLFQNILDMPEQKCRKMQC